MPMTGSAGMTPQAITDATRYKTGKMSPEERARYERENSGEGGWSAVGHAVKTIGETAADVGTLGGYSRVKEGLGGGESSSLIDDATPDSWQQASDKVVGKIGEQIGLKTPDAHEGEYDIARGRATDLYNAAMGEKDKAASYAGSGDIRNVKPVVAPSIGVERVQGVGPTRAADAGPIERVAAAQIGGSRDVTAPSMGAAYQVSPGVGFSAQQAVAGPVGSAVINQSPSNQIRDQQLGSIQALQEEANGGGAGAMAAKARLDAAMGRIAQEQAGIAGQARGAERGGARREQMLAVGRLGADAATQGEVLAQQERMGAKQQLTQALSGTRGQDVDLATKQADLQQQASNLEAQIASATSLGNAAEANRLRGLKAQLDQEVAITNANSANARTSESAKMQLDAATGNADRALQASTSQAGLTQGASLANANSANARTENLAGRQDTATQNDATRDVQVQTTNAGNELTAGINRGAQSIQTQTTNNEQGVARDTAAANAKRSDQDLRQGGAVSALNAATGANQQELQGAAYKAGALTAADNEQSKRLNGTIGGLSQLVAAHGGIVTKPTQMLVGEAGPELIIPIKSAPRRLAEAMSVENKPFDEKADLAALLHAAVARSRKKRAA